MSYKCPVCEMKLTFTPYYNTKHGKVCECCYESNRGEKSCYQEFCEKESKNDTNRTRKENG